MVQTTTKDLENMEGFKLFGGDLTMIMTKTAVKIMGGQTIMKTIYVASRQNVKPSKGYYLQLLIN